VTTLAAKAQTLTLEVHGMTFAALTSSPADPGWRAAGSLSPRVSGYALDLA
jgi:hypothetical protein